MYKLYGNVRYEVNPFNSKSIIVRYLNTDSEETETFFRPTIKRIIKHLNEAYQQGYLDGYADGKNNR